METNENKRKGTSERTTWNHKIGRLGEDLAAAYLEREGYEILNKNYRCSLGEIDLIAEKNHIIHFVEVKTRTGDKYGSPGEAIDQNKLKKIRRAANHYITYADRNRAGHGYGFHAIEISLRHLKDLWT